MVDDLRAISQSLLICVIDFKKKETICVEGRYIVHLVDGERMSQKLRQSIRVPLTSQTPHTRRLPSSFPRPVHSVNNELGYGRHLGPSKCHVPDTVYNDLLGIYAAAEGCALIVMEILAFYGSSASLPGSHRKISFSLPHHSSAYYPTTPEKRQIWLFAVLQPSLSEMTPCLLL